MGLEAGVRGYLLIRVEEANGRTQDGGAFTWDASSSAFEAFVKVELRGGVRGNVKVQSSKAPLIGDTITWRENLKLEVSEGADELRMMLCRDKIQGTKKGTSVIAACGIFVDDIIDAVPIDKYFELFKPNAKGEGGSIRVCMDFAKDLEQQGLHGLGGTILEEQESLPVSKCASPSKAAASGGREGMALLKVPHPPPPSGKQGGGGGGGGKKAALIAAPLAVVLAGVGGLLATLLLKKK